MGKKQKNCDPTNPDDDHKGDWWDHIAYDPEHKLVLAVVPGARVAESVEEVVVEVKDRLGDRTPELMTSDAYAVYETVIATTLSEVVPRHRRGPVAVHRCPSVVPTLGWCTRRFSRSGRRTESWRSIARSCWVARRR